MLGLGFDLHRSVPVLPLVVQRMALLKFLRVLISLGADSVTMHTSLPPPPDRHGLGGHNGERLGEASHPGPRSRKRIRDDDNNERSKPVATGAPSATHTSQLRPLLRENIASYLPIHKGCYIVQCRGWHSFTTKAVESDDEVICDGCDTVLVGGGRLQL